MEQNLLLVQWRYRRLRGAERSERRKYVEAFPNGDNGRVANIWPYQPAGSPGDFTKVVQSTRVCNDDYTHQYFPSNYSNSFKKEGAKAPYPQACEGIYCCSQRQDGNLSKVVLPPIKYLAIKCPLGQGGLQGGDRGRATPPSHSCASRGN